MVSRKEVESESSAVQLLREENETLKQQLQGASLEATDGQAGSSQAGSVEELQLRLVDVEARNESMKARLEGVAEVGGRGAV